MAIVDLKDSKVPHIYSTGLYSEKNFDVSWEHCDKILDILVNGITECLKKIKKKDKPVSIVFKELSGELLLAATVEYFPNEEDEKKPGNWNYSWTFYEDDLPAEGDKHDVYDPQVMQYFKGVSHTKYGMIFDSPDYAAIMFMYLIKVIKQWLDDNASESDVCGLKLDGIIQFRVSVENGEKVFAAEPDGEIKQMIKDDAAIEA